MLHKYIKIAIVVLKVFYACSTVLIGIRIVLFLRLIATALMRAYGMI